MIRVTDKIADLQSSVFINFMLHCLLHYLTHRLDKKEEDVARVVDLHAASSKPHDQ